MALTHGATARDNMANGVDDAVNAGTGTATFKIFDGATEVVSFNLQDPAFGAASSGTISLAGVTLTATAAASGANVDKFEIRSKSGTVQVSGAVATSGSDLNIDNTNIVNGQTVKITSFDWNAPS